MSPRHKHRLQLLRTEISSWIDETVAIGDLALFRLSGAVHQEVREVVSRTSTEVVEGVQRLDTARLADLLASLPAVAGRGRTDAARVESGCYSRELSFTLEISLR